MSEFNQPNPQVVEALEAALASARQGRIVSLGIVGVTPLGQYMVAMVGSAEQIVTGAEIVKNNALQRVAAAQGSSAGSLLRM